MTNHVLTNQTDASTTSNQTDSPNGDRVKLLEPEWVGNVEPWPEPVNGKELLDEICGTLRRFVVLPMWAAETLALWIIHTFAFELRDISTYLGIESPEKRCGKTTLLNVLGEMVNRAVASSNISSPAFFRVIEEKQPTLLIDEADTFVHGNDELRGILNSGYSRRSAYVVRVVQHPGGQVRPDGSKAGGSSLARFSTWCPKAIAAIGRLPDTLSDRCITIRMQRKTLVEKCERFRRLKALDLKRKCARFILDNAQAIADANPELPAELNDRAADIWEPLFAIADLAGGQWPELSRKAALALSSTAQESTPGTTLLVDIALTFLTFNGQRLFSSELVEQLNAKTERPWRQLTRGRPVTELWLSQQLIKYDIRPRVLRIDGAQKRGYELDDFWDTLRRYISTAYNVLIEAQAATVSPERVQQTSSEPSPADTKCKDPAPPEQPGSETANPAISATERKWD